MLRRIQLIEGELYHIYNRGAHKNRIFTDHSDYARFQMLLYLCNNVTSVNFRDLQEKYKGRSFAQIYSEEKQHDVPVSILGYCLMPNHFHLILRQEKNNGITNFMKKVGTAYSMYFNTKYGHSGVLFQGRFKSKHIDTDAYAQWIFSYVHLNPLGLAEPDWKEKGISDKKKSREFINSYLYSSRYDYCGNKRPEGTILSPEKLPDSVSGINEFENLLVWLSHKGPSFVNDDPNL